jgi:uncharacterized protein
MALATIPGGTGVGVRLARGQHLRVVDPEGGQSGDLVALHAGDRREWLSNGRSFDYNGTLYLTKGHVLYSNRSNPMLAIVEDDVGRHDFLYAPCSIEMYRLQYGVTDHHPNCLENLGCALELELHLVPTAFNLFLNAQVQPDGRLVIAPPTSKRGDAIVLRAEMDLHVALSACPVSLCSGGRMGPLAYEVL